MRGMRRAAVALGLATAIVLGLAGSGFGQSASPDEKITLDVGTTSDMVSPNPFKACCTSEY